MIRPFEAPLGKFAVPGEHDEGARPGTLKKAIGWAG